MKDLNVRRVFLYLLIGSVGLSAIIGIFVIILGSFGSLEVRILMTTLTVTATSILGLACGAYFETGRGRILPIAGVGLTVLAAGMTLCIVWDLLDESELFVRSSVTVLIAAVACSHLSLLFIARLDRRFAWSRIAAVASIGSLAGMLIFMTWAQPEGIDLFARITGVLAILVGAITVMTPVFHKLSATHETDSAAIDREIEQLRERIAELEARKSGVAH